MKDLFGELGTNPKFKKVAQLAFYSIFVFIAIILINTAEPAKEDNKNEEKNNQNITTEINLPEIYEYKYSINLDDKIYSYQGSASENINTFKKNKDNKITEYKLENNVYYVLNKDKYEETTKEKVYDIIDYEYLDIENINSYLKNSEQENEKYYMYYKDSITGEKTDKYIVIELKTEKVTIDYSKAIDTYNNFMVIFEYNERN